MRMVPFAPHHAEAVLGWPQDADELERWASVRECSSETLARWHANPDVHPFVLELDGIVRGYGEIWEDHLERDAEITRVILDPEIRNRRIGRIWVGLLAERAHERGWDAVWLRVVETNAPAIACYRAAGFVRADPAREAAFNAGQPKAYVWMRHRPAGSASR